MGQHIKELSYIGLEVSDLSAWRGFASAVLGLGVAAGPVENSAKLRMDGQDYRILLSEGAADDIAFAGWRVADDAALHAYIKKLDGLNVTYQHVSQADCAAREIDAAIVVSDPQGLRHEIFTGKLDKGEGFTSNVVNSGFITGAGGLGHIVFGSSSYADSVGFAKNVLEAELSDTINQQVGPQMEVDVTFMHVNERHHSIAYANRDGGKRLHHFMVEVGAVDDVGRARDRHLVADLAVAQDIGQHPNDCMISYYGVTPSGFLVEYGWGGRKVDPANWQAGHYKKLSEWGHRPYGALPKGAKGAAARPKPAAGVVQADGNWILTLTTPMGAQTARLVIADSKSAPHGTMETPGGDVALLEARLDGPALSWKSEMTSPFPMTLTFAVRIEGDRLAGGAESMLGQIPVTGVRA